MTKKQKKNCLAKITNLIIEILICFVLALLIIGTFALASLQASYRYNPPTAQEVAKHPILIKFLTGGE